MINLKIVAPVTLTLLWILFLTVHYFSVYLSAYEAIWWLDILMHTWGGFMIVSTWYQVRSINAFPFLLSLWWLQPLVVLMVAMIIWELFEYKYGLVVQFNYLADTVYDILCGFSGGVISFMMFHSRTINK